MWSKWSFDSSEECNLYVVFAVYVSTVLTYIFVRQENDNGVGVNITCSMRHVVPGLVNKTNKTNNCK